MAPDTFEMTIEIPLEHFCHEQFEQNLEAVCLL